ncbi:glycolate oxidase subunit GlcE [Pseudooceanicola algae]|uniref:Uncharacterized protein n=1 Tax=Pseudooceanicola algae TaxID=1537215 RepID=A0A418SGC7_9RHOB|nr:glycolate oxidase subunit GlcE [Pseudooceanicola algae]QPM91712.1 hypothetical protein PSAL_029670 [Pseudooceanicola algae]
MRPASEIELAEAIRDASGALRIRGGGTRGAWVPGSAEVLETAGLAGIRLYEPGALTLVVGAGTSLAEVEAALAEKGQRLAFEPMDNRALLGRKGTPTIGGVVAANISGPRRVQAGAARDFLLGVRFVDGAGQVLSNGGRVMKNVTGYDLVKLMAGSWGTLGVLSEVSLKVLARPQAEATLVLRGQGAAAAVADLCRAMGTPWDVSGAAWRGPAQERLIRVEGLLGSVTYRAGRLRDLLGADAVVTGEESATLWRDLRDVTDFAGQTAPLWRISLKPTDGPALLSRLEVAGISHQAICDWSGGLVWLQMVGPSAQAGALRAAVDALGGHATLMRASEEERARIPMFHPEPSPVARLTGALRARFDPRGILNPGLMQPASVPA